MDNTVIFSLTSNVDLVKSICAKLGVEPGKVQVDHFSDGETMVEIQETVRGKKVFLVQSTFEPVNDKLMEILIAIDALKRASASEITVIIPYFGYARQDRKARQRQPITAKLVANLLTVAGANRVVTVDLHTTQIQGFFDFPSDDMPTTAMYAKYIKSKRINPEEYVVVSPDHGGATRARNLAEALGTTMAIIDKRRPRPNVVEVCNVIGDVKDKKCIIVDDICDTAGSLCAAAKILQENGAVEVNCCITHPVLSGRAVELIEESCIKKMIVTDTIPLRERYLQMTKKFEVISIDDLLSKLIYAIASNEPLSAVYKKFVNQ